MEVVVAYICAVCRVALAGDACRQHPDSQAVRRPEVVTTPRYLELSMSEEQHERLLLRAGELRRLAAAWTSTSEA